MRTKRNSFSALLACLLFSLTAAGSLNRGTVQGTVTDPEGAVVPSISVTVINSATGVSIPAITNSAGFYYAPELVPGPYRVKVAVAGFAATEVSNVQVKPNDVATVDLKLELRHTVQQVQVVATNPLVETTASNSGVALEQRYVENLPLLGRDIQGIVALIPGAIQSFGPPGSLEGFEGQYGGFPDPTHTIGSQISLNGGQAGANLWYLDGNLNAAQGMDNAVVNPSPDAVSEFQAVTNSFAPEYGRNAGGVFNVVLKSGGNAVHGDTYEYNRNSYFRARNPFAALDASGNQVSPRFVNRNQFGGTLGGPVYIPKLYNGKNRTFFFAAWDISMLHERVPGVYTVPTVKMRSGDFSEDPNIAQYGMYDPMSTKYDPNASSYYTRDQFTNPDGSMATSLPGDRIDHVAQWYVNQYPLPNYLDPREQNFSEGGCLNTCNNYISSAGSSQTTHSVSLKVDHVLSEKHRLFAEWLFNPTYYQNFKLPWSGATAPVGGFAGSNPYKVINQIAAIGLTSTLSPTLINEAHFNFSRQALIPSPNPDSLVNNAGVQEQLKGLNIPTIPLYAPVPQIGIGSYGQFGPTSWSNGLQATEGFTIIDNVTKVLAKHTLKAGFLYRGDATAYVGAFPVFFSAWGSLTSNPNGGAGGSGLAQFMLGAIDQYGYTGYFHSPYTTTHSWGFYWQDDWRVTRKLTVNAGLRYDIYKWPRERHDDASFFDFSAPNPDIPTRLGRITYLGTSDHAGGNLFPANRGDFAPRLNFAYVPFADKKTVVRGGIDVIYTNGTTQLFGQQNGGSQFPGLAQYQYWDTDATGQEGMAGTSMTPAFLLSHGAPSLPPLTDPKGENYQALGSEIQSPAKNQYDPMVALWNLQIQRELPGNFMLSVGYVGSKGTHLIGDEYRNFNYVHTADALRLRTQVWSWIPTPTDLESVYGDWMPMNKSLYRFPQYSSGVQDTLNGDGSTSYQGLQAKMEKRFSHGFNFLASYAWQKNIASQNLGGYFANPAYPSSSRGRASVVNGLSTGNSAQDPDNLRGDRALASDDIPHIFNVAWTYELPFGKGKPLAPSAHGLANAIIGGWKFAGDFNAQVGVPLWVTSVEGAGGGFISGRPNLVGNPNAGRGSKTRTQREDQYFNPAAFEPNFGMDPAIITAWTSGYWPDGSVVDYDTVDQLWKFGTAGLRIPSLRSPGFWGTDMALQKQFNISEQKYFEFRVESYNAMNHQNWAIPESDWCLPPLADGSVDAVHVTGCHYGRITNIQTDPRHWEFALKFVF